jgi:hypothetical protein
VSGIPKKVKVDGQLFGAETRCSKERDEARDLLARMQSRQKTEALEFICHVRTHPQDYDISALIEEIRSGCPANALPRHGPQQQRPTYPDHCQ